MGGRRKPGQGWTKTMTYKMKMSWRLFDQSTMQSLLSGGWMDGWSRPHTHDNLRSSTPLNLLLSALPPTTPTKRDC